MTGVAGGVGRVLVGGLLGSLLRIQLALVIYAQFHGHQSALLTSMLASLAVNLLGAFLIGVLGALYQQQRVSERLWQFAGVGLFGAFTTFSAFALDALVSLKLQLYGLLTIYVGGSLLLSVVAAGIGYYASHVATGVASSASSVGKK